jgi:hypothetical protein
MEKSKEINENLKEELRNKLRKLNRDNCWIRKLTENDINLLIEETNFLRTDSSLLLRKYYFLNNFTEIRKCLVCGKEIIPQLGGKFALYCSDSCRFSEKAKKITRQKINDTCIEKYGNKCSLRNPDVAEKAKETFQKKYGKDNYFQSKENQQKIREIVKEKYNVESISQLKDVKEKVRNSMEKYSKEERKAIRKRALHTKRDNYYDTFITLLKEKDLIPMFSKEEYINADMNKTYTFKCEKCGRIFEYNLQDRGFGVRLISCPNRAHWASTSHEELEVFNWIKSLGIENIEQNKRNWNNRKKFYEADIFLPDYKLVIEFNGLYWHSNLNKPDDYHFKKWKYFKNMDIDCIQIFENEWKYKPEIIKDAIRRKLKINKILDTYFYEIVEIDEKTYEKFIFENYIFDYEKSEYIFGIFTDNDLVAVIGISRNQKYNWLINSLCVKVRYDLNDIGYSFIFNYIKEKFKGSIAFIMDARYLNDSEFIKNRFKISEYLKPSYYYFKRSNLNLYPSTQYKSIKSSLSVFNSEVSEQENMLLNDYLWIYDAGKVVYAL